MPEVVFFPFRHDTTSSIAVPVLQKIRVYQVSPVKPDLHLIHGCLGNSEFLKKRYSLSPTRALKFFHFTIQVPARIGHRADVVLTIWIITVRLAEDPGS